MILLDSHALLWWSGEVSPRLSSAAADAIERSVRTSRLAVSAISIWEISMLFERKRIELSTPFDAWLGELDSNPFVEFIPIDNRIAVEANQLPGDFHRDPADRLIVATARLLDMPLLTADTKILDYPFVQTIW